MIVLDAQMCSVNINELRDILKIRLSKKRYTHSLNVADAALKLAEKYGADIEKAYLAGLVHDICKEVPTDEQLAMAQKCRQGIDETEQKIPALYHSAAGSWYGENVLHIHDEDILNAVRYHTTGRAGMSRLEECVYLADLISEDRTYKDVGRMRRLAFEDINGAMLEAARFTLSDVIAKGSFIPENSMQTYNYYTALIKQDK